MKSLRKGIGNKKDIEKYYDNWSSSYVRHCINGTTKRHYNQLKF